MHVAVLRPLRAVKARESQDQLLKALWALWPCWAQAHLSEAEKQITKVPVPEAAAPATTRCQGSRGLLHQLFYRPLALDEGGDVLLRGQLLQGAVLVRGAVREAFGVVAVLPELRKRNRDKKSRKSPEKARKKPGTCAEAPREAVLAERGLCEEVVGPGIGSLDRRC